MNVVDDLAKAIRSHDAGLRKTSYEGHEASKSNVFKLIEQLKKQESEQPGTIESFFKTNPTIINEARNKFPSHSFFRRNDSQVVSELEALYDWVQEQNGGTRFKRSKRTKSNAKTRSKKSKQRRARTRRS